jgi:ribosomal protein L40E
MKGMVSLSTSCKTNPYCEKHSKVDGSVCQKCYAQRQMKMYKNMSECFERNAEILTNQILKEEDLPVINVLYFRFEAFGDIMNETQVINYFNICKKNPEVHFALWTKNPHLIVNVAYQKPDNLVILASSLYINKPLDLKDKFPFIDKIFTVYDKETIEKEGIDINCGARNCLQCHKCYQHNEIKYINERLK